ncbi:MAG: GerMN domain-containing protein [Dethiobacteria bacterium]
MKKVQPYYFLIGLAIIFVILGAALYGIRSLRPYLLKQGAPIEPQTDGNNGNLFELWFTGAKLFDLSVDRNVTGILFGTDAKKVSLLDRERRLRWEKSFSDNPLQTKISDCGRYLAVGTEGGELFFMSTDEKLWWEHDLGEPIYLLALSSNGRWVLIARGRPEEDRHRLELYDGYDGSLQWSISTRPLQNIYLSGEQYEGGRVFYSFRHGEEAVSGALSLAGEHLWEGSGAALAAVYSTGSRLALLGKETLQVCNYLGETLWERSLPAGFKATIALFNPRNGSLLLYGISEGQQENLLYFSAEGESLWQKKIAEGALLSFTSDGSCIIACSWRHYKEGFSQMVLINESGEELTTSLELGMRVERLLATGRRYIVLGGEDGYIDVIDLTEELVKDSPQPSLAAPFYSPAISELELEKGQMPITLFFNGEGTLIPVTRLVSLTESPLRAAIEELMRGPSRDSGLYRTIPKEAKIEVDFDSESGKLSLAFYSESGEAPASLLTAGMLDSLCHTLGAFPEVREIYLTADGEPLELRGENLPLEQPLKPYRWRDPVYLPLRVKERYYLVPYAAKDLGIEKRDLDGLLRAVVKHCRTFYFVPGNLELIEVRDSGTAVTINLNSSFCLLFPEEGDTLEQLQAAMILDALFLTASRNSESSYVEILVEGERWSPPQGYPPLSRLMRRSYYINPEF